MIPAIHRWPTNGHLIADVAKLGYLPEPVLDLTYGLGTFWTVHKPTLFVGCDINPEKSPIGYPVNFLAPPDEWHERFASVVFDPPYKLNGTPSPEEMRYGIGLSTSPEARIGTITAGALAASKLVAPGGYLLVKCQDQVASRTMHWQTDYVTRAVKHMRKVDRFDLIGHTRPQPEGRRQLHAFGRGSTLLVFKKVGTLKEGTP